MSSRTFVPGAIASPGAITLPADAPDIDAVVTAQIIRVPSALTIPDHAVHSHPFAFSAGAAGATIITGAALLSASSGAQVVAAGGVAGDGVRNIAAAQAHGASVGASPVVAAVPTLLTARTFSLDVNTVLGDLLTLNYREVGERVLVS